MKPLVTSLTTIILINAAASLCLGQNLSVPEDSGLVPRTGTFYVNTNYLNNGGTESEGVAITANGNVLLGWEDDGSGLYDFEAAWTLFDGNGNMLTLETVQTNRDTTVGGYGSVTNTFLSYYRTDGTPIPAYTAWGPKIKANLFGNGMGMGGTAFSLGLEEASLVDINLDLGGGGDFAAVQMLNNDGSPVRILTGGTDGNYEPVGDVRVADFDFLSNGNILIVNESRQADDRALTGQATGNVPTYRIVTPAGVEVKAWSAVNSDATAADMWHGAGVTANGFALRFDSGGAKVRLFDNAGNPTGPNIDVATLTGIPATGNGGRGDSLGFHGNGRDAYVQVNRENGSNEPYITVLNADGTLRWSRRVGDEGDVINAERVDGAIAPDGRVIAVWGSQLTHAGTGLPVRYAQGRLFRPDGTPMGSRFLVSEYERPDNAATGIDSAQVRPRVAWRGDTLVITWPSVNPPTNDPLGATPVLAARIFTVPTPALSISKSGGNVVLTWGTSGGTLETADALTGPWTQLVGVQSPYTYPISSAAKKFFRVQVW